MLTTQNCTEWLTRFAQIIEEKKEDLCQLDTPIGDGDHGSNMSRGMQAVLLEIKEKNPATLSDLLKLVAMTLISKVGGASGPLYGTAFLEMAKKAVETDAILPLLEAGCAGIMKRGGASAGEKTMLDVWIPTIDAIKKGDLTAQKIELFVTSTISMQATKGRASYLGKRSIGHQDPGATSSAYLFQSMLKVEEIL